MAIAKVILNGNTLIDTTDKTVASSNLLYSNTALGADGEAVTGAVKIGDITIKPENCLSSNTQITPETYVFEDNNLPGQSFTIDNFGIIADFKQTNGIKLESGKTYHCIAHVFVKWDDDDSEEYCYADSNFVKSGTNITLGNFNWEGSSGATQTITSITLQPDSSNSYKVRLRIDRNTSVSKSGVLLPGSFYRITQVDTNGYDTINLDFNNDPRFYGIYQSLVYRSTIASSAPYVSEWCNNLSSIASFQFAGQSLSGSFIFNNVSSVGQYAFAWNYIGGLTGGDTAYNLTFPILSRFHENSPFAMNRGLISIYCPSVTTIGSYTFYNCFSLVTISFPECTTINNYAFQQCSNLTIASFPKCTNIGGQAFQQCSNLTSVSFPECTTIGGNAFYSCSKLASIYFPKCTTISNQAFYSCSNLTTVSFPECTSIGSGTFQYCSNLTTISLPKCTSIGATAFSQCSKLTTVSFPECLSIDYNAFYNCYSLATISFPKCTYINYQAFYNCSSLISAYFPECSIMSNNVFRNCVNLTTVSFPKCISIYNTAFQACSKLESAYFMASSIISLGANVFTSTPMSLSSYLGYFGSIYVPASLLASYKTATNWAAYSSRMVGI